MPRRFSEDPLKFEPTITYPAPFAKTEEMLSNENFYRTRAKTIGVALEDIDLTCRSGRIQASSTVSVASGEAPAKIRRFIPDKLQVTVVEAWGPTSSGSRPGSLSVAVSGVPVMVSATSTLTEQSGQTKRVVEGEISVKIPFVGKMIEQKVSEQLGRAQAYEEKAAATYLAQ